jgi:hypothetical protein
MIILLVFWLAAFWIGHPSNMTMTAEDCFESLVVPAADAAAFETIIAADVIYRNKSGTLSADSVGVYFAERMSPEEASTLIVRWQNVERLERMMPDNGIAVILAMDLDTTLTVRHEY